MLYCHLCGKYYKWRTSLDRHHRLQHNFQTFPCQACNKIFKNKTALQHHESSQHNVGEARKFICDTCGNSYTTKWGLSRHKCHHNDDNLNPALICKFCGKVYHRKDTLEAHERTHRPKTVCDQCGKEIFHISIHKKYCSSLKREPVYQCRLCTRKFKEERYLKEHLKSKHNPTQLFKCDTCEKWFNYRASLLNHKKTCQK